MVDIKGRQDFLSQRSTGTIEVQTNFHPQRKLHPSSSQQVHTGVLFAIRLTQIIMYYDKKMPASLDLWCFCIIKVSIEENKS